MFCKWNVNQTITCLLAKAPILDFDVGDSSRSAVQDLIVSYRAGSTLLFSSNISDSVPNTDKDDEKL